MMRWWLERKRPEELASMMPKMMGKMFSTMDPEKVRSMMEVVMPSMIEQCFAKMNGLGHSPQHLIRERR